MRLAPWLTVLAVALAPRVIAQALPELGGPGDAAISPQVERRIGESLMREIRARDPSYYDDAEISDYLAQLGSRLVQAGAARQDFEFFAMRDATVNAFAMPGGFVGVHTGLIAISDTESELASVLAHEVAHVTQRHLARMLGQEQRMQLPMLAALAAAVLFARSRPDLAAAGALGAQGAAVQSALSYSRDFEREADRVGLQTLQAAGFDTRAMAAFFEKLQRATRVSDDGTLPGYLRTHPVTVERIADAQNKAAAMPYRQHLDSPEFQFVRAKLRAEAGDAHDAAASFEAAVRERRYVSEAAARYGLASALLRAGKLPEAQAQIARVRALGVASPMLDLLAARARRATGDAQGANELLAAARARYPYSRAVIYAQVAGLQEAGRGEAALDALADAIRLYPRDARLYEMRAQSSSALGKRLAAHQAQGEAYALQGSLPAAIEQLQLARQAGDGDFYQLSVVDARLRELRAQLAAENKEAKAGR